MWTMLPERRHCLRKVLFSRMRGAGFDYFAMETTAALFLRGRSSHVAHHAPADAKLFTPWTKQDHRVGSATTGACRCNRVLGELVQL